METQPTDEQMARFFKYALRYAMRWHKSRDDALQSDEYSDACWGIFRALRTFDPSKGANINTHVTHGIIGHIKAGRRDRYKLAKNGVTVRPFATVNDDDERWEPASVDPVPRFEREDTPEMIAFRLSWRRLDPTDRRMLKACLDSSQSEVAKSLGCSRENVSRRVKRAMNDLKQQMRNRGFEVAVDDRRGYRYWS